MSADQKISTELATVLQDALDRPIAFHRTFVKLTGSVTAALLLSQAVYWSKRTDPKTDPNKEGWFYKIGEQWEEETGLSRFEQEGARKILRKFSFWKEELRGVPAKMHYCVDIRSLSNELISNAEANTLNKKGNKNARLLKTSKQACGKAASKHAEKPQTSSMETSEHYKGISETTAEIKTTTPEPSPIDPTGGRVFVQKLLIGTMLHGANPGRIVNAANKYKRTLVEIEKIIDVFDQQYRASPIEIGSTTGLIVDALMQKDIPDLPEGYMPKAQREAEAEQRREAARRKADEKHNAEEAENSAFKEAERKLSALPKEEREVIFSKAKKKLPVGLRNSPMAVKSEAIRIMIADSQFTERKGR